MSHPGGAAHYVAPLGHHVGNVILGCSEKQVVWSDAATIVAAMANEHPWGNLPIR